MPYKVVTELQKERCKLIKEILGKLGTSRLGEVTVSWLVLCCEQWRKYAQKMCFVLPIYLEDSSLDFPYCSAPGTEEGCRILQKTGRCWISLGFWPLATENLCGQAAGPVFKCSTMPQQRAILHQQVPRTWNTHCHLENLIKSFVNHSGRILRSHHTRSQHFIKTHPYSGSSALIDPLLR